MCSYRQDGCHVLLPAGRLPCALTGRTVAICALTDRMVAICALTDRTVAMCSYRQDGCHVLVTAATRDVFVAAPVGLH